MHSKPLDRQVIVITDAHSEAGLATAETAVRQGAHLVLAPPSERACDREEMEWIAETAIQRYGRIDTWVNNASADSRTPAGPRRNSRRLSEDQFWGVVHGSLAALPHLRKTRGALINVGSGNRDGWVRLQGRNPARQAITSFTRALEAELAEEGGAPVRIRLIQPAPGDRLHQAVAEAILAAAAPPKALTQKERSAKWVRSSWEG